MMKPVKHIFLALSFTLFVVSVILFSFKDTHHSADFEYRNDTLLPQASLSFSAVPGFYSKDFELEILAPSNEIYYTLDGTDPDKSSIRYTEPIMISDATNQPNVHSARIDTSAGYLDLPGANVYTTPDYLIDKCTIIRAAYYDQHGNRSPIKTGTYFVGFDEKAAYDNIHVLSVITDPDHLFDRQNGIYILGDVYDNYVHRGKDWWWWDANYHQSGREWERPATIQLFNSEQEIVLTQDVGVRIQGGGSRGYCQKSLNLYARDEYAGNTKIHYDFWNTGYLPERLTVSICGDDYKTKIKDRLGSELLSGLHLSTMHYLPCLMFLDGEFWGLYYITEKYDPAYIQHTYHVDADNAVFVKNGSLDFGLEEDLTAFVDMKNYMTWADLSLDEKYQEAWTYLDKESMLDYLASMIYISRIGDFRFAGHNSQLWRSRKPGTSPYADCKWRWTIFDLNSERGGIDKGNTDHDTIDYTRIANPMVNRLFDNKQFREDIARRIIDFGLNRFSKERVNQKIDSYLEELNDCYAIHKKRFGISDAEFQKELDHIRYFFEHRYDYVITMLKNHFPELDIDAMHAEAVAAHTAH